MKTETSNTAEIPLNNSGSTRYPKLKSPGDSVEGTFVSFTQGVKAKFGPEDQLVLRAKDGSNLQIRCQTILSSKIRENLEALLAHKPYLVIEMTGEAPSARGNPMKLFSLRAFATQGSTAPAPVVAGPQVQVPAAPEPLVEDDEVAAAERLLAAAKAAKAAKAQKTAVLAAPVAAKDPAANDPSPEDEAAFMKQFNVG